MKAAPLVLPCLLALASCSSPPKPPSVDESTRRPANLTANIDLQACRSELQNTLIVATENARAAQASGTTVARLIQQQTLAQATPALSSAAAAAHQQPAPAPSNTIHTIYFAFASSRVSVSDAEGRQLIDEARGAPLIVLRGRTDGNADSIADSRLARLRAEAVRDFLVRGGVDPARIRSTWQPYGDAVADNSAPSGRSLNRRVEIETYRSAPEVIRLASSAEG
jgi:outer membrane protein OmpA-like peptidoglycan-associated protein